MKKMPLGIQSFRKIVEGNYVYVDKTQYIYSLINNGSYYFLSRPRRFGKSLLLDTMAEAMSGNKELFKGLFIYDSDYGFEKHPVLRLDMSNIANETPEILKDSIASEVMVRAEDDGLDLSGGVPSDLFKKLIRALYKKYNKGVVVLIDEYDKPILDQLTNIKIAEANRQVLGGVYGVLKSLDPFLKLTFITGVSKFTKTSIFSELNNLLDITMTEEYSNICGVAVEDLGEYFGAHIEDLAKHDSFKHCDSIHDEILAWYDGYSWDGATRVINPFSLLSFFEQERFSSFWFSSGTPKFLVSLIKTKPASFLALKNLELSERSLDSFDIHKMSLAPLLFQTGYLTVDKKRHQGVIESYLLKMPNLEVREAFNLNIAADFTGNDDNFTETAYWQMKESLRTGDLQNMLATLRSLFASIPYELHISKEAYYHSIFYAIINLLGFSIDAEASVSGGRVDAVLEFEDKVYIMEFKYVDCAPGTPESDKRKLFDKALQEGLNQIESRGYAKKYAASGKEIIKAAFAFLGRDDIELKLAAPTTQ